VKIKTIIEIALGILLVIIGLIGGLIPIFQGWIFGIPGLVILSKHFKTAKTILKWAKKKITNDGRRDDLNQQQQKFLNKKQKEHHQPEDGH
tara:strand:- start:120 stop:392 length:273 start_codon:yes stop_codon:yes gene_type:complete